MTDAQLWEYLEEKYQYIAELETEVERLDKLWQDWRDKQNETHVEAQQRIAELEAKNKTMYENWSKQVHEQAEEIDRLRGIIETIHQIAIHSEKDKVGMGLEIIRETSKLDQQATESEERDDI